MDCKATEIPSDLGCIPGDPVGFVETYYAWGLGVVGLVAFLIMIIGGYIILTSGGNPDRLQKGKEYIFYAIAGVLLAIFGFVFMQVIAGNVLRVPGFG